MRRLLVPLLALLLLVPVAAGAARVAKNFTAHLTGAEEVPPRATDATGQAKFRLLKSGDVAFRLIVDDIENVVAAHIHCGDRGVNGPVVQFLFGNVPPGGGPVEGVLSSGTFNPDGKTCTFGDTTVSLLEAMRGGRTYVNVHTSDGDETPNEGPGDFPGGEIRGQIQPRGAGG
jgi:CHRD domain